MACDCFEKVSAACDSAIRLRVGEHLAEVADSSFEHTLWHFNGGDHSPVALNYRFRYYRKRKNGLPESRLTNADTVVSMRYCPFCGAEFEGEQEVSGE
ncbi:Uncharacterised protein [Cedecea neteri]|uniref:Uncharacterized protein n=1 Tax=Cedecea neteri TaxID=158822 RepID=A0A291DX41_9ENTR|nr:hypothetical protein CO704_09975 [Cedecea neteri]SQC92551.1 Uncharacterised protein [Cedecea neteri]